ncbi:aldehyde dehydrogenase family protein [Bizionia argentinensis JUB59]|uniref:Aldehyde dehydrogenase n=1 Tax=Bizionia argentinensis JUB59 TaxID=1046627 RepID=G2ECN7_9FLAO|nr:aldehyde dehydrogenase family protein [Bizionia argentinensis]EGV43773.1 aldehyde dehydrogenase family protein [Bizionia argentinensis JUB59]
MNTENPFSELFQKQKANQFKIGNTTYKERIAKLKRLQDALENTYKQDIREALFQDFKKPFLETDLTEIYPVIDEIKFAISNLKSWLKPEKVATPVSLLGSSSFIVNEPKGVCLIISPWNYPINLTFAPLVSAIVGGNTAILKPSEMTPNTSKLMAKIVSELFDENEIALVEGEVETSEALLELPFNHIFFTGSPAVGKIVMKAASKNLTSVTLELGGKSPTIIDDSSNLEKTVKKIVYGKFTNAGQTCIAPDYVLLQESLKPEFVALFKQEVNTFYSENPESSDSYSRIVNSKHFERLTKALEDAKIKGSIVESGGDFNVSDCYIEPTLVSNLPEDTTLMQEEIFGPILPLKTYKTIEEAVAYVNANKKPLALYIFSKNKKTIDYIIENTRAGSTCVNHILLQFLNHNLPFGGSNNSGIGKSHGVFGFREFTNQRSVLKQHTISAVDLLIPPYTNWKKKLVNLTIKWF